MDTIILTVTVFTLQLISHYLPWQKMLKKKMSRPTAYVIGTLTMMLPFTTWVYTTGNFTRTNAVFALWSVIVVSGVAVIGSYKVDAIRGK